MNRPDSYRVVAVQECPTTSLGSVPGSTVQQKLNSSNVVRQIITSYQTSVPSLSLYLLFHFSNRTLCQIHDPKWWYLLHNHCARSCNDEDDDFSKGVSSI